MRDKIDRFLNRKEEWLRENPDKGIDYLKKKEKLLSEFTSWDKRTFKLISLNSKYLELFPKISKNYSYAAAAVVANPDLYNLFPQFHENVDFCYRLVIGKKEYASGYDDDFDVDYEYYSRPEFYKFIPETVVKDPKFLQLLLEASFEKGSWSHDDAFSHFSKLYPDFAVTAVQEKLKDTAWQADFEYYRNKIKEINNDLIKDIFSDKFCNELKKRVIEITLEKVSKINPNSMNNEKDIVNSMQDLDRLMEWQAKRMNDIDKVDEKLIDERNEEKRAELSNKISSIKDDFADNIEI